MKASANENMKDLGKLVIAICDSKVQWSQPVVLLALQIKIRIRSSDLSSDIYLDDILDGVWKMPNEGSSNLCVDQTEGTNELFNEGGFGDSPMGRGTYVTIIRIRTGREAGIARMTRIARIARMARIARITRMAS